MLVAQIEALKGAVLASISLIMMLNLPQVYGKFVQNSTKKREFFAPSQKIGANKIP